MLLLCCSYLLSGWALAAEPVVLDSDSEFYALVDHTDYFIEPRREPHQFSNRALLPELVERYQAGEFAPVATPVIGFGAQWSLIHLRVPWNNPTDSDQTWVLAFNRWAGTFNSVSLVVDGMALPTKPIAQTLSLFDWQDSDFEYHTEFSVPANSSGALYVSYSNGASQAALTLETVEAYKVRRQQENNSYIVLLAVTGAIGLMVTLMMLNLGISAAYYYATYLLVTSLFLLSQYEYLYRWWYFDAISYVNQTDALLSHLAVALAFLFQRAFVQAHVHYPRLNKFLLGCVVALIASGIFNAYTEYQYIQAFALSGVLVLLIPVTGIIAVKQRMQGGWPFFISSCVVAVSFLGWPLWSVLSPYFRTLDLLSFSRFALIFEAFAFAFAMFSQVRGMREDRERALQAELQATHEKLNMAETLITTAHDLQQPLASLRMTLQQSAAQQPLPVDKMESAVAYLDEIVSSQLTPLVSTETADSSSLMHQSHDHPTKPIDEHAIEQFCVDVVLQNAAAMFWQEAADKGVDLRVVKSTQKVSVSPLILMRVVSNLVSNAVKNTQSGKVLIGCRSKGLSLKIAVYDTGQGVSEHKLQKIQQAYQRDGDYAGTGLGLSIVHQLCGQHGLAFKFASIEGKGSVASVLVPLATASTG